MAVERYALAAFRADGDWVCEPLPPSVMDSLGILLQALRSQPPEGGPFVIACVDSEFFLLARMDGAHINLMLSDLTAAVDYPLAAEVLDRFGEEPPEEDELDEIWPLGDLDLLDDLGVSEDDMEGIVDDLDAFADEMLEEIAERIGITEQFTRASKIAQAAG